MITLTQGQASESIFLTLKEKSTLDNPTYRLLCENTTTKETVEFELGTDLSDFKNRFNRFEVNTLLEFENQQPGQWNYTAIENTSNVIVEVGKLLLNKSTQFEFDTYNVSTSYKVYGG